MLETIANGFGWLTWMDLTGTIRPKLLTKNGYRDQTLDNPDTFTLDAYHGSFDSSCEVDASVVRILGLSTTFDAQAGRRSGQSPMGAFGCLS
jgi:hypothetical protein